MEEWEITTKAIDGSSNLTEQEKNDYINYLSTKIIPDRLRGPERTKMRDLFRKTSKKFAIENVVTSNCMKKELVYNWKEEKRFVLVQIISAETPCVII